MAGQNYVLAVPTYWSNTNAGIANGLSVATRKVVPTDILSVTVNADAGLNIVHDSAGASFAIVLGNNTVAACTFTCYGSLNSMDETGSFLGLLPVSRGGTGIATSIRCAIGGTTSYKNGVIGLYGAIMVANIDFGSDASGNAVSNAAYGILSYNTGAYHYNCTSRLFYNPATGNAPVIFGTWESSVFYGGNNGASYCIGLLSANLIACTVSTSGTSWLYNYAQGYIQTKIIGGLTLAGGCTSIYLAAQSNNHFAFYRRAYLQTTSGGSPLAGVAYGAYEATGGIDQPLTSGITPASGQCDVLSPTLYGSGGWRLQKVETYVRTTAGAMTWGTPTTTQTFGNYTEFFQKSGYGIVSQTHDYSDGNNVGIEAAYTAVAMTKLSAIPCPSNSVPLSTFSDADCTTEKSSFVVGDTVYINGDVNLKSIGTDTRSALTTIKVYRKSDDSLIATLYNDTDTLTGGTTYNYKTSSLFGNGTAYNVSTVGYTPGEYYVQVSTSGTDITTQTSTEYFIVSALPIAIPTPSNNPPLSVFSDLACTTRVNILTKGDTGYINGGVNLQSIGSEVRTATTLIQIRAFPGDAVIATLYNGSDALDGDTNYSYKDDTEFGGGTAFSFDTSSYTPGKYYIYVATSGTNIETEIDIEMFEVVAVPDTPSAFPKFNNTTPLSVFSDAACTIKTSSLTPGDIGRVSGDVNLANILTATRDALLLVEIRKVSDDSLKATLYNDTDTLTGGTTYNFKTATEYGGGTAWSFDTTGYASGEYYIKVTISGSNITTMIDYEYFVVASTVITVGHISRIQSGITDVTPLINAAIPLAFTFIPDTDITGLTVRAFRDDGVGGWIGVGTSGLINVTAGNSYTLLDVYSVVPATSFSSAGLHSVKLELSGGTPALYSTINAIVYFDVLTSTPTPVVVQTPESFQREAIKIFDEVGLIKTFLKDDQRNHLLRLLVKNDNVLSKPPVTFINIPAIVVEKIAFATKIQSSPIPPNGNIGHVWQSDIEITLVCPENMKVTYPSGTALNGAEEVLNALYWVVYSMFSNKANKSYYSTTDTTFGWDENAPVDIHYLNGGYMGVPDLWAIVLTFRFQFEGER